MPMHPASFIAGTAGLAVFALCASAAPKRALEVEDFDRLAAVDGVVCSRDGLKIAYTVEQSDADSDERKTTIWLTDFEGKQDLRLTEPSESASNPKFSPDGRYVSFVAARGSDAKPQIHLLDLRGGEPQAATAVGGDIADYAWSPDARTLVISMTADKGSAKTPPPIVIDRVRFKEDRAGYLTAKDRTQLYLVDVSTRELTPLTRCRHGRPTARPSHSSARAIRIRTAPGSSSSISSMWPHGELHASWRSSLLRTSPRSHGHRMARGSSIPRASSRGSMPTFRIG
jgi:dipeptidyl aminopeptidase/acylaminoacyl peptidase